MFDGTIDINDFSDEAKATAAGELIEKANTEGEL